MEVLYYIIFALISWFLLLQIFRFSTYHKHFKYAVFAIIAFSILNGYLLYYLRLHSFFIWHLTIFLILFFTNYKKQKKAGSAIEHLVDFEKGMTKEFYELSLERTFKYYIISAITYLIFFAMAYIYFYN